MYDIVIAGAGGCGREVYEMALDTFSPDEYRIKEHYSFSQIYRKKKSWMR